MSYPIIPITPAAEPVPVSLCDHCVKPGACCNDMVLSTYTNRGTFWADEWPESAVKWLDAGLPGHPFAPLRLEIVEPGTPKHDPHAGDRPYGFGHWACTKLAPDGRCGDYENRPALCKAYEPASDRLCVMYVPPLVDRVDWSNLTKELQK